MGSPEFDFDEVFDEGYLYSYDAVELRDWLLEGGFDGVDLLDAEGDALASRSRRMLTIAHR